MNRFLSKLDHLISVIERDYYLDKDHFQLLLESHWIHSRATAGTLMLPTWELYMFQALNSPSLIKDKDAYKALVAVTAELRH